MAYPPARAADAVLPGWKTIISLACGSLLGLLFIASGVWKITDPLGWSARVVQMRVPGALATPLTLLVATAETFAGVLLIVPRFRRWGAWLAGLLLIGFMAYFALYYDVLRGEDCSCFPWLKRVVGPGFFITDAAMLLAACLAGWWAATPSARRGAALVLAAIAVFTGASFGVAVVQQRGIRVPAAITLDGRPASLRQGRVFIYFIDPECAHCFQAARRMAAMNWKDTRVVVAAMRMPQFGQQFLNDTGLRAALTPDGETLRKVFSFVDPPYGVLLEDGWQKAALINFDEREPAQTLRRHGFIQ